MKKIPKTPDEQPPALLAKEEIEARMEAVPAWHLQRGGKVLTYRHPCSSAIHAMILAGIVVVMGELHGHEVDVRLNGRWIDLRLTTTTVGGLTARDFEFAKEASLVL